MENFEMVYLRFLFKEKLIFKWYKFG
jgi:hypothetical protein